MTEQAVVGVKHLAVEPDAPAHILMNSDEELVGRSRRGDDEAFRVIFERYARPVTGFILGMVGQPALAEELAQETFIRAHRKLPTLREPARLSTWLFGIAKNVAREALAERQAAVRRSAGATGEEVLQVSDRAPLPDEQLFVKELHRAIGRAFLKLDDDKRMVFTLRVFQHRSYEEIVEITGFSLSKIKTDLSRARAEMRRLVGREAEARDAL